MPAADQRVTAWARELEKAGLDGGMDALRARAFLDILLGMDSRPPGTAPGMIPPGFAGHVNLTIPAATLTRGAGRPGELGGIGPVEPDPEANTSNRY